MDIEKFIDKWVNYEDMSCCFDLGLSIIDIQIVRSIIEYSNKLRREYNYKFNDSEEDTLLKEEQLQHPVIAMQEARIKFVELYLDFEAVWSEMMHNTIFLQGEICGAVGTHPYAKRRG